MNAIEDYHHLPDLQRKMKKKDLLVENIIKNEGLDDTIEISTNEIYDSFVNSK